MSGPAQRRDPDRTDVLRERIMQRTLRTSFVAIGLVAVLALLIASCGGDDDDSSATTASSAATPATASKELCRQRDELEDSIKDLRNVDVVKNGTSALQEQLDTVKDNLEAFKSTAKDDFRTEIDDFQSSLDDLRSAVANVGSGGGSQVVSALSSAVTSGQTLLTSLESMKCE
jgi:hypothetical protein